MGGRGRRKGNGEEGGTTREGGRAVGGRHEREREGRMKKIGGEHITAGSYYNPAVMLTYYRRFVIRPGGDRLSPPVRNKPAVMECLR